MAAKGAASTPLGALQLKWCDALSGCYLALKEYCEEYHKKGLVFSGSASCAETVETLAAGGAPKAAAPAKVEAPKPAPKPVVEAPKPVAGNKPSKKPKQDKDGIPLSLPLCLSLSPPLSLSLSTHI
ncbi:hypothetical protein KIPB_013673, partial [Kipferlia bialata]|eukprot:g13673.t1